MRITQLVKGAIGAAAVAMLLAPTAAQGQVSDPGTGYVFNCPACTTNGQSWAGPGSFTYKFAVPTDGVVEFEATASAGDMFVFYWSTDPTIYGLAATQFGTYSNPESNSRGAVMLTSGHVWQAGVQYYLSATATCTDASAACNVRLYPGDATEFPTVVPEPMTMVLLGTGLVGVVGLRRRRRAQELETGV